MNRPRRIARPASRSGAGLFLFLAAAVPICAGACGPGRDPGLDPEQEAGRALGLPAGARLHRVTLGGRGAEEHAVPRRIEAAPGDAVEFLSVDHRVHVVTFPADSLLPEARAYLERTRQAGSAPLAFRGSRFLLLLDGAPPGRYPFVSEGHGGVMGGVIEVDGGGSAPRARPT